jgi:RNA polymerase sigma factor for flagellar operon FliA
MSEAAVHPLTDPEPGSELMTATEMRERTILAHLPRVKVIARRIHERLPACVSLDDLISTGVLGLIAAIDRYDPTQEVKLPTYAEFKIRGAILDSLRGLDWAPRLHRKRLRLIEAAITALEQQHKRVPVEEEIAAYLHISLDEYHHWLADAGGLTVTTFGCNSEDPDDRGNNLLEDLAVDENCPSHVVEKAELQRLLAESIEKMPSIERTILSLYYYEEMTLKDISKVIDLRESRISQLKAQAILRLRCVMQKRWPSDRGCSEARP